MGVIFKMSSSIGRQMISGVLLGVTLCIGAAVLLVGCAPSSSNLSIEGPIIRPPTSLEITGVLFNDAFSRSNFVAGTLDDSGNPRGSAVAIAASGSPVNVADGVGILPSSRLPDSITDADKALRITLAADGGDGIYTGMPAGENANVAAYNALRFYARWVKSDDDESADTTTTIGTFGLGRGTTGALPDYFAELFATTARSEPLQNNINLSQDGIHLSSAEWRQYTIPLYGTNLHGEITRLFHVTGHPDNSSPVTLLVDNIAFHTLNDMTGLPQLHSIQYDAGAIPCIVAGQTQMLPAPFEFLTNIDGDSDPENRLRGHAAQLGLSSDQAAIAVLDGTTLRAVAAGSTTLSGRIGMAMASVNVSVVAAASVPVTDGPFYLFGDAEGVVENIAGCAVRPSDDANRDKITYKALNGDEVTRETGDTTSFGAYRSNSTANAFRLKVDSDARGFGNNAQGLGNNWVRWGAFSPVLDLSTYQSLQMLTRLTAISNGHGSDSGVSAFRVRLTDIAGGCSEATISVTRDPNGNNSDGTGVNPPPSGLWVWHNDSLSSFSEPSECSDVSTPMKYNEVTEITISFRNVPSTLDFDEIRFCPTMDECTASSGS